MLNLSKKLFYPCFLVLFLLSFFLMESEYKFYLFSLWSIFLLFYSFIAKENPLPLSASVSSKNYSFYSIVKNKFLNNVFVCTFLFMLFALISSFFSHHISLSLEKYLFYLVSISIFLFFLRIKRISFKAELFVEYFLLLTFVLNILVIFLSFIPNSREIFQGMNLLVRSYGHNHYVAFLLLVLPLIWWHFLKKTPSYFLTNKKLKLFFDIFLFTSSYLLLLISLSRWALLIGIIQFFSIFLLNKKAFARLRKNKIFYFLVKTSILAFLSVALIFLFLSLPLLINEKHSCSLSLYRKDLCIALSENSRFFYWRQAWLTFRNYPIFGHGLGSFRYAARRFPIAKEQHSSYAHNIFLHNLAEMGVLGGASFILFILFVFYKAGCLILKSKKSLNQFLYLAAVSSLINAMLDFDWHFFVIFLLTIVFLAIILSDASKTQGVGKTNKLWSVFLSILAFFTTLLAIANILIFNWQSKNSKHWLKLAPFLNFATKLSAEEPVTSVSSYEGLYDWYRYDTEFIYRFLKLEELSQERKVQLYLDLAEVDPAGFIKTVDFKEINFVEAEPLLSKLIEVIESHNFLANNYFIDYLRGIDLGRQIFDLAQEAYYSSDWIRASNFYQIAYIFDPYVFFDQRSLFLDEDNFEDLPLFLLEFKNFSPHNVGDFDHYILLYKQTTTTLFKENRLREFEDLISAMLNQEPGSKWYLVHHLNEFVENEKQESVLTYIEEKYK